MTTAQPSSITPPSTSVSTMDQWFATTARSTFQLWESYRSGQLQRESTRKVEEFATGQLSTATLSEMAIHNQRRMLGCLLEAYIKALQADASDSTEMGFKRLAFDWSSSRVLVWVEIPDDCEELKYQLVMAEAEVNAEFEEFNYSIDTLIVEERDQLGTPPHYVEVTEGKPDSTAK